MTTKELQVKQNNENGIMESVLIQGDLSKLTAEQRSSYYLKTCESLGLNPYTKPFDYINLNGKLTLYAKKDATDQLRNAKNISVSIVSREKMDDIYVVLARATDMSGRTDEAIGVVNIANQKGDALANLLMKAESKAKRRVTLSICGLGWTDETEIETIPNAKFVPVDHSTGEIVQEEVDPFESEDNNRPTEKQLEFVKKLAKKFHNDKDAYQEFASKATGNGYNPNRMTKDQVNALIDALIKLETKKTTIDLDEPLDYPIDEPDLPMD